MMSWMRILQTNLIFNAQTDEIDLGGMIVKNYGVNELRRMFLEFFESKEHLAMKSFSLVPHNHSVITLSGRRSTGAGSF